MPTARLRRPGLVGGTSFVVDPSAGGGVARALGRTGRRRRPRGHRRGADAPATIGGLDVVAPIAFVPEHGSGFPGRPGLSGHRAGGEAWAPRFVADSVSPGDDGVVDRVGRRRRRAATASPTSPAIRAGRCASSATLTNDGVDDYWVDDLAVTLALPAHVGELMTFHGRWCREFHPLRRSFDGGPFLAENRRGRTSHESPPLLCAGTTGFGEQRGEVWGAHLAWSGNSRVHAARLPDGRAMVQLGELLHPGEIVLSPGERYSTPPVYAVHSVAGLGAASRQFHAVVRSSPAHRDRPRPVVLNTWEAVYFDHDFDTLVRLAERAASVGVERFVLDDGWFGGRRDDTAGLGDWWVSPDAHPKVWRR